MVENTQKCRRYWLHAVTPIHLGAGRGLGYIDLPVAREAVTNWPYIPGSAVKGVIVDRKRPGQGADEQLKANFYKAFGREAKDVHDKDTAGSLIFTDAHILCLPVRSFFGTFAWITSPFCLKRFVRDGQTKDDFAELVKELTVDGGKAIVTSICKLTEDAEGKKIYLEDLDLETVSGKEGSLADTVADLIAPVLFSDDSDWQTTFKERFAIVHDDVFTFLCETGTEVNAHIRINDTTGIVKPGALWYEESLPVETILSGMVWCEKVYQSKQDGEDKAKADNLLETFCVNDDHLQIGGKASTGKGIARLIFEKNKEANSHV